MDINDALFATALTAMTLLKVNITCDGNIAGIPDRMLPYMWNALSEVRWLCYLRGNNYWVT